VSTGAVARASPDWPIYRRISTANGCSGNRGAGNSARGPGIRVRCVDRADIGGADAWRRAL